MSQTGTGRRRPPSRTPRTRPWSREGAAGAASPCPPPHPCGPRERPSPRRHGRRRKRGAALLQCRPLPPLLVPTTATSSNGSLPRAVSESGPSRRPSAPAHPSPSSLPARTRTRFTSPPRAPPSAPCAWCSRSSRTWDSSSGASRLPPAPARPPSRPASPPQPPAPSCRRGPRLPAGIASPGRAARPRRASCSRAPSWCESLGKGSPAPQCLGGDVAAPGMGNCGRIPPRMAETGKVLSTSCPCWDWGGGAGAALGCARLELCSSPSGRAGEQHIPGCASPSLLQTWSFHRSPGICVAEGVLGAALPAFPAPPGRGHGRGMWQHTQILLLPMETP